ncbi:DUF397 domain-containing protein [Streptomyces sp. YIM S03343]
MNSELAWIKSSFSDNEGGLCVEIALTPTVVHIRDSKTPARTAPVLTVAPTAWAAFLATVRHH